MWPCYCPCSDNLLLNCRESDKLDQFAPFATTWKIGSNDPIVRRTKKSVEHKGIDPLPSRTRSQCSNRWAKSTGFLKVAIEMEPLIDCDDFKRGRIKALTLMNQTEPVHQSNSPVSSFRTLTQSIGTIADSMSQFFCYFHTFLQKWAFVRDRQRIERRMAVARAIWATFSPPLFLSSQIDALWSQTIMYRVGEVSER